MLDNCSQQTFISEKIVRKLGLIPINEINRNISAFGGDKGQGMLLKEYNIVLQPTDRSSSIFIKALTIPVICAPSCRRYVKLAMEQNKFLKVLKLADNGNSKNNDVDMLIGADVYWNIVGGNLKRSPKTGIVAISSALGWLVNGPITDEPEKKEKL